MKSVSMRFEEELWDELVEEAEEEAMAPTTYVREEVVKRRHEGEVPAEELEAANEEIEYLKNRLEGVTEMRSANKELVRYVEDSNRRDADTLRGRLAWLLTGD